MLTKNTSADETFQILKKAYDKGSMMCISTPGKNEEKQPSGLLLGHAYSITKITQIQINSGRYMGTHKLVRIRNPWGGCHEWNGAWSDSSEEMASLTETEKEENGIVTECDGEFFMSIDDVINIEVMISYTPFSKTLKKPHQPF